MPVCLVAAIWTGNVLFFARQIDPVLGTLVFVVEVGLSVWVMYLLRGSRYRWRTPSFNLVFFSILGIALVCAFAGIEPLAGAKDEALSWAKGFGAKIGQESTSLPTGVSPQLEDESPPTSEPSPAKIELYVMASREDEYLELRTIEEWNGSSSRQIELDIEQAPAVINCGYESTSEISTTFVVYAMQELKSQQEIAKAETSKVLLTMFGKELVYENGKTFVSVMAREARQGPLAGVYSITISESGKAVIDVRASGCDWWARMGVE